jgi:protein-disulfide isomerase
LACLDEAADHACGSLTGRLIVEFGDYECPCSRQAFLAIETRPGGTGPGVRFDFRRVPLTRVHPQARAAAAAGGAAAVQGWFWDMHELLFQRRKALGDAELRRYAAGLELAQFDPDCGSVGVLERIRRDVASGITSGEVRGTPTLFIGSAVYRAGLDPVGLLGALAR